MIEALFIIAIGALILLYAQRQSDKKTIEQQDYKLRRYEGRANLEDETEARKLQDWYHFDKIMRQLRSEDDYSNLSRKKSLKNEQK